MKLKTKSKKDDDDDEYVDDDDDIFGPKAFIYLMLMFALLIFLLHLYVTHIIEPILAEELPSHMQNEIDLNKVMKERQEMKKKWRKNASKKKEQHQSLSSLYSVKILKPHCKSQPCYNNNTILRFQISGLNKKQICHRKLYIDNNVFDLGITTAKFDNKKYNTSINLDGLIKNHKHRCKVQIEVEDSKVKDKNNKNVRLKYQDSVEFIFGNPPKKAKKSILSSSEKITNKLEQQSGEELTFFVDQVNLDEIINEKNYSKLQFRLNELMELKSKYGAEDENEWINEEIDIIKFQMIDVINN
jgi:hypothetical protein